MKNTGNKTFLSNLKKYGSKAMMFLICTCILMSVMSGFTITAGNGAVNYSAPNLNIDDSAKRQLEAELDKLEKEMDSLGDSMDALEAKKRQLAAEMGENAANIATLEEEKTTLDKEMNTLKKSITAAEELLKAYETEISNIEAEIIKREKAYEEKYRQFGERLRITHEAGRASDLELLFGAKSLSEFLSCVNRIGEMLKHDENMMKELEQERLALEALRALNEENRSKQIATIVDLGTAENELNTKIAKSENLISNAYDKQESIEAQQQMTESEQAKKEKQQAAFEKEKSELQEKIRQEEARLEAERIKRLKDLEAMKQSYRNSADGWLWPLPAQYTRISSPFGYRNNPFDGRRELHNGIDLPAPRGTSIYAAAAGKVIVSTYHWSYGNYVEIDHGDGYLTLYAHCSELLVKVGDIVEQGQVIAKVGTTGSSTGNHLHFSTYEKSTLVDPKTWYGI